MSTVFSLYYMSRSPRIKSDEPAQSIHNSLQMKLLQNKPVENQFVF